MKRKKFVVPNIEIDTTDFDVIPTLLEVPKVTIEDTQL
jgi:hypothetical protein